MPRDSTELSRRRFVRSAVYGTGGVLVARSGLGAELNPYGPFKMGLQSYSLRGQAVDEALATTQQLGLHYWEAFGSHFPLTRESQRLEEYRSKLKAAKVVLLAYGVEGFDGDEQRARGVLDFAVAMGIRTISADPSPEALPVLDKLLEQYRVSIAIHNHGPGARYDKIQQVWGAMEGHHRRIGACIDTGHYLRSGEDPVAAAKQFGRRVYGVHLKDVKGRTEFTELGKGDLDLVGFLKALRAVRYVDVLALEYEEHADNPKPYIQECLDVVKEAVTRLR